MKFANKNILILAFVVLNGINSSFLSSFLSKSSNTETTISQSNTATEAETEITGFKDFVTEARGHMLPQTGICSNPTQCRTLNEIFYIGYKRTKAVKQYMNLKEIYVASVNPKMNLEGVTKIMMSAPALMGANQDNVKAAPIFRICIPTDRSRASYADYQCPMMDCPLTLDEAKLCTDDPSVPFKQPGKTR